MNITNIMKELEKLGTSQTKKTYQNHGAQEPLFGVILKDMKPFAKNLRKDYVLAMQLYAKKIMMHKFLPDLLQNPLR